jgi:Flp pilus assembly protein TadD
MPKRISVRFASLFLMLSLTDAWVYAQTATDARSIADQAVAMARLGDANGALPLFAKALDATPDDISILRDYAIVLGWAGKYSESMPVVRKLQSLDSNQPDWAVREYASIFLFGDAKSEALSLLDSLIAQGDMSEQTLMRRALALRWMGRSPEAQAAYRTVLQYYPKSAEGAVGLAYSIADEGRLSEAIRCLDSNMDAPATDPVILKAKIRLRNWAGRHYEAQNLIAALPANLQDDREVLEDRITAARWGGNPSGAMHDLRRLVSLFPSEATRRISKDLRTDYGESFAPSFRYGQDSDGLVDRSVSAGAALHVNPAHVIHLGYQYRWLQQATDVRRLVRYELGWSGDLNRRLAFYTTAGTVDYRTAGLDKKIVGDGTLSFLVNPQLRVSGGGGSMAMDAYQAIPHQVTAPFEFGEAVVNPISSMRVQGRFSHYAFSDAVVRDRADFEFMQSFFTESHKRLNAGWRSDWMRHDGATADFWSPEAFQSHIAVAQSEGKLTSWLDYWGEVGAGWQQEPNAPLMHPLQTSGKLLIHPGRNWRLVLEAGRSTSSLDRVLPGGRTYSRWVAIGGMEFRIP